MLRGTQAHADKSRMKGEMEWVAHREPRRHNANGMSWQAEWRTADVIKSGRQRETQQAMVAGERLFSFNFYS